MISTLVSPNTTPGRRELTRKPETDQLAARLDRSSSRENVASCVGVIGIIVPDVADPQYCLVIQAAEAAAARQQCVVATASSGNDRGREERVAEMMAVAGVDGLLVVGGQGAEGGAFESLRRPQKPVVHVDAFGHDAATRGVELLLERMSAALPRA